MSGSVELQIEHVVEGKRSMPKNNCFRKLPMYWPVWNLMRHVFWTSVMRGFVQNSLESFLSMSAFPVHFLIFGKLLAMSMRYCLGRVFEVIC